MNRLLKLTRQEAKNLLEITASKIAGHTYSYASENSYMDKNSELLLIRELTNTIIVLLERLEEFYEESTNSSE